MTTYIESKLNPDGTYDHSEVIEAHKNGADVEYFYGTSRFAEWVNVKDTPDQCAEWADRLKYRAVIEDKPPYPQFFKQDSERFQNRLHEENRMKAAAVIEDEPESDDRSWNKEASLINLIYYKFQSDSTIPVERITLTRAEVNEVFPGLLK